MMELDTSLSSVVGAVDFLNSPPLQGPARLGLDEALRTLGGMKAPGIQAAIGSSLETALRVSDLSAPFAELGKRVGAQSEAFASLAVLADTGSGPTSDGLAALARLANSGQSRHPAKPKRVQIFVRKGAHDQQRWLSFRRPDEIPASELLDLGLALDGNQAIFAVTGAKVSSDGGENFVWDYFGPFVDNYSNLRSLPEALAVAEKELIGFFKGKGFTVDFS